MNLRFHLQRQIITGKIDLHISDRFGTQGFALARNITFQEMDENTGGEVIPPLLQLKEAEAQHLADALYEAGIRPSQAAGSAGQLAAVQFHLEDMRSLVFKKGMKP